MDNRKPISRALTVVLVLGLVLPTASSVQAWPMDAVDPGMQLRSTETTSTVYLALITSAYLPTIIPDTTQVLTEDTTQQLVSVSEDGATFAFSAMTPELADLDIGDVMVGNVSDAAPHGFLRQVASVTVNHEEVTVTTTPATLEDAIQQGRVSFSKQLTPADVESMTALPGVSVLSSTDAMQGSTFYIEINDVVLHDLDGDYSTTDDQLTVDGSVELEPGFDFDVTIVDSTVQDVEFLLNLRQTAELEFQVEVEVLHLEASYELARLHLGTYVGFVGPVPIVLVVDMPIYLRADGDLSVGIVTSVTQQADILAGLRYADSSWTPVGESDNNFSFEPPRLSASAELKGYLDPPLGVMLYGVGGPFAAVNPYLKLEADVFANPWWELYGGIEATVGIKGEVLGRSLGQHTERVIGYRRLLAQADSSQIPGEWTAMESGTTDLLTDVWGSSGTDVFAVSYEGGILHYDGSAWSHMVSNTAFPLRAIWGSSGSNVFAVGGGWDPHSGEPVSMVLHYDGSEWSCLETGIEWPLYGVWGTSASNVLVVGGGWMDPQGPYGVVFRYDGTSWHQASTFDDRLSDIWGSSDDDVFAVGGDAWAVGWLSELVVRYDGTEWQAARGGFGEPLRSVWGTGPNDVFVVGESETILRYDGVRWNEIDTGAPKHLLGIWGTGANNVFAVGGEWDQDHDSFGVILHYDGRNWRTVEQEAHTWLRAVWGTGLDNVFVVGGHGTILHYSAGFTRIPAGYSFCNGPTTHHCDPGWGDIRWTRGAHNGRHLALQGDDA